MIYLPSDQPSETLKDQSHEQIVEQERASEPDSKLSALTHQGLLPEIAVAHQEVKKSKRHKIRGRIDKLVDEAQDLVTIMQKEKKTKPKNWKFAYEMYCREIIQSAGLMQSQPANSFLMKT